MGFGLRARIGLAARDDDVRTGGDETLGDGAADPPSTARDDRDTTGQVEQ